LQQQAEKKREGGSEDGSEGPMRRSDTGGRESESVSLVRERHLEEEGRDSETERGDPCPAKKERHQEPGQGRGRGRVGTRSFGNRQRERRRFQGCCCWLLLVVVVVVVLLLLAEERSQRREASPSHRLTERETHTGKDTRDNLRQDKDRTCRDKQDKTQTQRDRHTDRTTIPRYARPHTLSLTD
jgi:hypothetical protein